MLSIDNCKIDGFSDAGIAAHTSANAILNVTNTIITNASDGIFLGPNGGALNGSIDHTTIRKMSSNGISASGASYFTVTNSAIVNAAMSGVTVSTSAVLEIDSSSITNNNTAFQTNGGIIRISRNTIYDNNTNFAITAERSPQVAIILWLSTVPKRPTDRSCSNRTQISHGSGLNCGKSAGS